MEFVSEIIPIPMTPQESPLNWREIEAEAAKVSAAYSFDPRISSVQELAQKIGGQECIEVVPFDKLENLDSGSLEVFGQGSFKIYLSPITSMIRDNFTVAHELGHYFLHSGEPAGSKPIIVGRSGDSTVVEQQANRFAAALLMPRESFTDSFKAAQGSFLVLSGLFNVSRQAVSVRAKSLGLSAS